MSIDVTDATFEAEVIERSITTPVVVDLWAEWCGPCKTLGPILEKVVDATGGKVVLAKVDVDANPAVSQAFRVQGIPAVHAVRDRRPVDSFVGAQPEAVVQAFVDRLVPTEEESELDRLVAAGDEQSLRAALELEPGNEAAIVALAELMVRDGRSGEALELLERIDTPDARRVAALARTGPDLGDDDIEARLEGLLDRVKQDDDARKTFVDLLEVLGPDDPRTAAYRKQLTARLF
jgi:putative thioredoxin